MKLVSINSIVPGDKISISVCTPDGRCILSAGTPMNELFISRLKQMGIKQMYIEEEKFSDIEHKEPISNETRSKAIQLFKTTIDAMSKERDINESAINELVKTMVEEVRAVGVPIAILNGLYPAEDSFTLHAVNTAILAVAMGMQLSFTYGQLCDACLAGLLHDIGRIKRRDDLIFDHAQMGFDLLRKYRGLSLNATSVALQHHENFNGTGGPRKLKNQQISELSRVISIVDCFDSLTSGQAGVPTPYEKAYEEIINDDGNKFDPDLVKAFKNVIQIYFDGVMVVLSDGTQGIVVRQNKGRPLRPIVKLYSDLIPDYYEEVDLRDNLKLKLSRAKL